MDSNNIKTVGVLTSGGDSPGMNAALRAVTRAAIYQGIRVKAIYRGYKGLIDGEVKTPEGRQKAYETLQREEIDALIVIGGDGTFTGGRLFSQEYDIPIIGLPGTIDNDLWGTDATIGYDTSLSTITECIDKLRDTATSHERVFLVEVMGRDAGFLTLNAAIAGGCERAPVPEQIEEAIGSGRRKSKNSSIVLVQEHAVEGGAKTVAEIIEKAHPEYSTRVTVLGHLQRGGSPSAYDRILASRMGVAAVQALLDGQRNVMVGIQNDDIVLVPLTKAIHQKKDIKEDSWEALQTLSI